MSDYLDTNGLQRVWGKFKENISSYKEIENVDIASFDDGSNLPLKSLEIAIEPQQDLHGYDAPWVGGAGKNKLPYFTAEEKNGIRLTYDNGVVILNGTASANAFFALTNLNLASGTYTFSANNTEVNSNIHVSLREIGATSDFTDLPMNNLNKNNTYQNVSIGQITLYVLSGTQLTNFRLPLQIEVGNQATTFAPYSNICPIEGWTETYVIISHMVFYNIQFTDGDNPLTVYGGTLDVVSGELVVDRASIKLNDLNWTKQNTTSGNWRFISSQSIQNIKLPTDASWKIDNLCSVYQNVTANETWTAEKTGIAINADGKLLICDLNQADITALGVVIANQTYCYELATPLTYQLTPTIIKSLQGENNLFASTGEIIKVEYQPDNIVGELRSEIQSLDYDIFIVNCINNNGSWVTYVTESELRKAVNENKKIFMAYKNRLVPFIEMTSYTSYPNTATFSCADFGQTDLINNKIGLTKTTLEISFSDSSVSEDIESLNLQLTV